MDDGLDDLFGEAPPLQLPPPPLSKGLLQRVDELCVSGCRQSIAWSKIGCLAYVSKDRKSVILQHLVCESSTGQWNLSKQYPLHDIRPAHGSIDLVHLSWSHAGNELAIIDVLGRISIYMMVFSVNRGNYMRRCTQDPEDDLGSAVGFMWLHNENPSRYEFFHNPMIKNNNVWSFSCHPQKGGGPHIPKDRSGFACVTRSGTLRVLFQQGSDRWLEAKADLREIGSVSELLTHASICPDKSQEKKDGLFVVTHSSERQIRLYRVNMDLEQLKINARLLKIIDNFGPSIKAPEDVPHGYDRLAMSSRLSFLTLISSGPESKSRTATPPCILAGFSHLVDDFQAGGEQVTIICRLDLRIQKSQLHASFDPLSTKNASARGTASNEIHLARADDMFVPKALFAIDQFNVNSVIALIYSDGSVEFRDRASMNLLSPDENDNRISSLHQLGFNFTGGRPCLHAGLSPNGSALLLLDDEHVPSLDVMQYSKMISPEAMNDSFFERICEGFVLQCSNACISSWNYADDFLYALQLFSNQYLIENMPNESFMDLSDTNVFKSFFLAETYRILGMKLDHSMDEQPEPGFKSPQLQRCASIQVVLGFCGNEVNRTLPGLIAWNLLQSRYCALTYVMACNTTKSPNPKAATATGGPENELKNPETVQSLVGLFKWYMDLTSYLVDEILTIGDYLDDEGTLETLTADTLNRALAARNSPALPLLLISTSRAILRFNWRLMRVVGAETARVRDEHNALGAAYREFDHIQKKAMIDLAKINEVLTNIDNLVKAAYRAAGLGDAVSAERQVAERDMLIKGEIPEVLVGVVKEILGPVAEGLREDIDVAELFFADVGWLGLTDGAGKVKKRKVVYDAMRKVELRKEAKLRRCTRCAAVTEDVVQSRGNAFVVGMQRDCFCGGRWMVVETVDEGVQG